MKTKFLKPEFVEFMPPSLEDGVVYVSMEYGTVIHSCCCGCGNKVVTPLSPTDWKLIYDGENISLTPSVGNWSFPCQSHYWIKSGKIEWSEKFSKEQIDEVRRKDKYSKSKHFKQNITQKLESKPADIQPAETKANLVTVTLRKISSFFQ